MRRAHIKKQIKKAIKSNKSKNKKARKLKLHWERTENVEKGKQDVLWKQEEGDVNRLENRQRVWKNWKQGKREEGSWKRGRESRAREGGGAWKPPKLGYLTPHTSRPSGQLTAISSMRWPTSCTVGEWARDTETRESVWRERGDLRALFIQWSLIKAGRSVKEEVFTQTDKRKT